MNDDEPDIFAKPIAIFVGCMVIAIIILACLDHIWRLIAQT